MKTVSVYDIPVDEKGVAAYVVAADTYVMNGDRVYAEPGDHIHGFRDKAGIQFTVYTGSQCPHPVNTEREFVGRGRPSQALLRGLGGGA